jgi:hypothetical protein
VAILELIHANEVPTGDGRNAFIRSKTNRRRARLGASPSHSEMTLDNFEQIARSSTGDASFKCLPYQLSMVVYATTMVVTGNGESGFDSGEGA